MIKKEIALIIFGVLLFGGLIGFVSAASSLTNDFGQMFDEISGIFSVFFSKVLGESSDGSMFFQRCLILLIVYGIVYMILGRISIFEGSSFLLFFVSFAVAVLGVKFLSPDFIQSVLLPYAALGGSLAIFLPYLIYFAFVHTSVKGTFGRRAAWILFGVIFFAIYISGGLVSQNPTGDAVYQQINWFSGMYFFGFILVVCAVIFDPQIHMYFSYGQLGGAMSELNTRAYYDTMNELKIYYNSGVSDPRREQQLLRKAKKYASRM